MYNNRLVLFNDSLEPYTDKKENLLQKLDTLKTHQCVAAAQMSFLITMKVQLSAEECVVLCDISV